MQIFVFYTYCVRVHCIRHQRVHIGRYISAYCIERRCRYLFNCIPTAVECAKKKHSLIVILLILHYDFKEKAIILLFSTHSQNCVCVCDNLFKTLSLIFINSNYCTVKNKIHSGAYNIELYGTSNEQFCKNFL